MVSNGFLKRFRKLDAYAKTLDDFRVRTATGGTGTNPYIKTETWYKLCYLVTLVCALTILTLLTFEIYRYLTPVMLPAIMVDGGKQVRKEKKNEKNRYAHKIC